MSNEPAFKPAARPSRKVGAQAPNPADMELKARATERISRNEKRIQAFREAYARAGIVVDMGTIARMAILDPIDVTARMALDLNDDDDEEPSR